MKRFKPGGQVPGVFLLDRVSCKGVKVLLDGLRRPIWTACGDGRS